MTGPDKVPRPDSLLTTGRLAAHLGVQTWQIQRLFARGLVPELPRVGTFRVIRPEDIPAIRDAAIAAGYLPDPAMPETPVDR